MRVKIILQCNNQLVSAINSCTNQDSGVYTFVAQTQGAPIIVLNIYAVSITNEPVSVYIKDSVPVRCNAIALGYLFTGLSQKWIVNDSYVIKNYGTNALASVFDSVASVVVLL
uniref:Uncharacterized protein n=1 Tax=Sipha flava TaxID=143950 RepID=A0A2S2QEF6_9HEMI